MSNHDFDPNSVLSFTPPEAESSSSDLESPGYRPMVTLAAIEPFPPSEKYPKPGSVGRIKFTWEVDETKEVLVKRVDLYSKLKTSQKMYELLVALVGEDYTQFAISDLEGCKCPIYVKHEKNTLSKDPDAKYADFTYETGPIAENLELAKANKEKRLAETPQAASAS